MPLICELCGKDLTGVPEVLNATPDEVMQFHLGVHLEVAHQRLMSETFWTVIDNGRVRDRLKDVLDCRKAMGLPHKIADFDRYIEP
jgi:hypothetical protein